MVLLKNEYSKTKVLDHHMNRIEWPQSTYIVNRNISQRMEPSETQSFISSEPVQT